MTKDDVVRAVPIGKKVKPIMEDVFGENFARRISYSVDMPKGLFQNGVLTYPAGTRQMIVVYGALSPFEISSLEFKLQERLGAALEPGEPYAEVILRVYPPGTDRADADAVPSHDAIIALQAR